MKSFFDQKCRIERSARELEQKCRKRIARLEKNIPGKQIPNSCQEPPKTKHPENAPACHEIKHEASRAPIKKSSWIRRIQQVLGLKR